MTTAAAVFGIGAALGFAALGSPVLAFAVALTVVFALVVTEARR